MNIRVKNIKTALQDYLLKNKITLTQLFRQIEIKDKILKLIIQLKKEKKERRRKKYKTARNLLEIKNKLRNSFFINEDNSDNKNKYSQKRIPTELETKIENSKRKMRLLLKFKHDIDYKIKSGEMNVTEVDIFSKFRTKIDNLIGLYNEEEEYEKKMEDCLGDFEEEMELYEQRRKDEKRINDFISDLQYQINFKSMKKKKIEEKFCNVVDYDSVNNINILNIIQ